MVKTEPGANKEDHDQLVEDIDNPEDNYGDDSHQGGDDTFGADDTYGAGGADDIGFEGDEGGAGPSEIGKEFNQLPELYTQPQRSYFWRYCTDLGDNKVACNLCHRSFSIANRSYKGIKTHLQNVHSISKESDFLDQRKKFSRVVYDLSARK